MSERKHDFTITLDATVEEVWRAITEGERIQQWFAPHAKVEPGVGGKILLSWGPGMEGVAPITTWEPGRRLGWTESGERNPPRVVEIHLEAEGGKTRLRLVHSGFGAGADFDGEYDSTHGGWLSFLSSLRFLVDVKKSAAGRHDCRFAMLKIPQPEAWVRLVTEIGLGAQDWTPGASYQAAIPGGGSFHGTVWAAPKPGYALLRVAELDDSLLGIFVEGAASPCYFTTSWFLYGAGALGEPRLLAEWAAFGERLSAA